MDALAKHLGENYTVVVEGLVPPDLDVYRVDGPRWVARRNPAGTGDAAAAAADLLRRLPPTKFPAERLGHDEPVSMCGGRSMFVTEFVEGKSAPPTRMFAALGAWLGGLHRHSGADLAPGGGWHHLVAQGTPQDEIIAAVALLGGADGDPAARRTLLDELRGLDDCADLPHAIVHPDFVPAKMILRPVCGLIVVDWAGSGVGRGYGRSVFLLCAAGARGLALAETVMSRYREHVQLTPRRARPVTQRDRRPPAHARLLAGRARSTRRRGRYAASRSPRAWPVRINAHRPAPDPTQPTGWACAPAEYARRRRASAR